MANLNRGLKENQDIDIVVLWVDGSDPAWLAQKAQYQPPVSKESNAVNRYRDWGLMRYWFRAIEKFAPWARKIHFVTWGHVPEFLNLDAPKLHVVRHDEFIPAEYLPTFNANTIEMNIHRIPGLAEHFIYFNDDIFLLQPHEPEDFFRNGLPCACSSEHPWITRDLSLGYHIGSNDLYVVNKHFPKPEMMRRHGKKFYSRHYRWQDNIRTLVFQLFLRHWFVGFAMPHAAAAYLKKTFEEVWAAEPQLLHETSLHKFRTAIDVNQWLCLWWQVAGGNFAPYVVDNVQDIPTPSRMEALCRTIENQEHKMLCMGDPDWDVDFDALSAALQHAFEKILPEKCAYEK